MTTPRPTVFPDFATTDIANGVYGGNNVIEPDATHKSIGWSYNEHPARETFNWLHRITNNWLKYLDDKVTNSKSVNDADSYFKSQW